MSVGHSSGHGLMSVRRHGPWQAIHGAVAVVLIAIAGVFPGERTRAQSDDEQQLVERYAPIMMLRVQDEDCDSDGEPFAPMTVDVLLAPTCRHHGPGRRGYSPEGCVTLSDRYSSGHDG
jgi:hypothetical protein